MSAYKPQGSRQLKKLHQVLFRPSHCPLSSFIYFTCFIIFSNKVIITLVARIIIYVFYVYTLIQRFVYMNESNSFYWLINSCLKSWSSRSGKTLLSFILLCKCFKWVFYFERDSIYFLRLFFGFSSRILFVIYREVIILASAASISVFSSIVIGLLFGLLFGVKTLLAFENLLWILWSKRSFLKPSYLIYLEVPLTLLLPLLCLTIYLAWIVGTYWLTFNLSTNLE